MADILRLTSRNGEASTPPLEVVMLEIIVFVIDGVGQLLLWLRDRCREIPELWTDRPAAEG